MGGETITRKKKKFAKEPNFTEKKNYRPKDVKETGLAFIGHEISKDGNTMNQIPHPMDQCREVHLRWPLYCLQ